MPARVDRGFDAQRSEATGRDGGRAACNAPRHVLLSGKRCKRQQESRDARAQGQPANTARAHVAHALLRAASRLVSTHLRPEGAVDSSVHVAARRFTGAVNYGTFTAASFSEAFVRSSSSMRWFTFPCENSAATRIALRIAFAFARPWLMMHTPRTPSSGAPPYSE